MTLTSLPDKYRCILCEEFELVKLPTGRSYFCLNCGTSYIPGTPPKKKRTHYEYGVETLSPSYEEEDQLSGVIPIEYDPIEADYADDDGVPLEVMLNPRTIRESQRDKAKSKDTRS